MIKKDNNVYEIEIRDIQDIFKKRDVDSHKGIFGKVGILGGSLEYSGAVKLAGMSITCLRSGCGGVRVIVDSDIASSVSKYLLEQTLYPLQCGSDGVDIDDLARALDGIGAVGVGMGLQDNDRNREILRYVLTNFDFSIVIDAGGLNILSGMDLDILRKSKSKIILTPHLKEFSRLIQKSVLEIKEHSLELARDFASRYHVILLLKGHETIITDGVNTYITKTGGAGMATSGSGDVLAGIIMGMLGYCDANILTVSAASFLAGLAGEFAEEENSDIAMIASDTINNIGRAIKYIRDYTIDEID